MPSGEKTLHFVHVGKTGGTAIKRALRTAGLAYWDSDGPDAATPTRYGRIHLHHHGFRVRDVPRDDYVFFCLRDPVARFFSAFYSRLNKGQPRYYFEWSESERKAFEAFPTPQLLAGALASEDPAERKPAEWAMRHIRHLSFMENRIGRPAELRRRLDRVVYIARQETLRDDFEQLKARLELPEDVELPSGSRRAHRRDPALDTTLDEAAERALRDWYARDYRLLDFCDRVRAARGWGAPAPDGSERLGHEIRRLRASAGLMRPRRVWRRLRVR